MISACSPQINESVECGQTNSNSTSSNELLSLDKQHASSDVKNPSVAKVVPFSHQPSLNTVKCSVGVCTTSATLTGSTASSSQIKSEVQTVSQCSSLLSHVNIPAFQYLASEDGLMTILAPTEDGQMQPLVKTICSCQLRQRALKYVDKGKTKDTSIIIDSDEEEDKNDVAPADSLNNQGIFRKHKFFIA